MICPHCGKDINNIELEHYVCVTARDLSCNHYSCNYDHRHNKDDICNKEEQCPEISQLI